MSFIFRKYIKLLQDHTLKTQMVTGTVLSGVGSCIAQHGLEQREWRDHQAFRTHRLMLYGGLVFAPIANRWHFVLNLIKLKGRWTTVTARVATDALLFSPFATILFYNYQGLMEGRPWHSTSDMQGIKERLSERLWPTVQKQWALFVPSNFINLAFVPLYARPPFINIFALAWQTYLAKAQNIGAIQPEEAALEMVATEAME